MPHSAKLNDTEDGPSRTSASLSTPQTRKDIFDTPTIRTSRLQSAVRWLKSLGREEASLKDVIEEALEENPHFSGQMTDEERTLLKNVVSFGELTVSDIMVPRTDIQAVERECSWRELMHHVRDIGHTRLPVYHESLDRVEGFLHVKDLFNYIDEPQHFSIKLVMREILFVPPSMRIVDLLLKMRISGCHMAVVVDEYGGTDGLVTMEDLFEEIVGEIQDEHDESEPKPLFHWVNDNTLEVDARAPIEEVEELLGHKLRTAAEEEEGYDTLGGYVFAALGRVPAKGEVVARHDLGLKVEVAAADPRRIYKLRIVRLGKSQPQLAK